MRAPRWSKAHRLASWILIGLFAFLAGAHVVLTVLFYTGVHDTGVGYVLDWEWPAWIITIIDAAVAWLLWFAYRRGGDDPRMGLVATVLAAIMALARAFWMVLVPSPARHRHRRVHQSPRERPPRADQHMTTRGATATHRTTSSPWLGRTGRDRMAS